MIFLTLSSDDHEDEVKRTNDTDSAAELPGFKVGDRVKLENGKTGVVRYICDFCPFVRIVNLHVLNRSDTSENLNFPKKN